MASAELEPIRLTLSLSLLFMLRTPLFFFILFGSKDHTMNDAVRQSEKLELLNRSYIAQNRALAATNDDFKGRIVDLESELATLRYRNRTLLQELSTHRNKKLPELEQHSTCDADIPPLEQDLPTFQPEERVSPARAPSRRPKRKRLELVTSASSEGHAPATQGRRVKIPTCYTLPSLKSKLRKGDRQTFRG